jgi:hypothetical protein
MEILLLSTAFILKHFLGDYFLQFPYMVEQKGTYGDRGGVEHATVHALLTTIVLLSVGVDIDISFMLAAAEGVVHYHIDWAKQNLSRGLTVNDRKFWLWFGADQALHYFSYVVIIGLLIS